MKLCAETWADEIGHNDSTNEHRCNEPWGRHYDNGGYLIHQCTCGAQNWEPVDV